jgi:uncharacterized protein
MEQASQQEHLPMIEVRTSGIHGTGVYAGIAIKKGECIIEYVGGKISSAEGTRRENSTPDHTFIFILNDEWDIDGNIGGNDSRFINHSCSPNAEIEYIDGHIWIVAGRDIAKGEELTYDYAFDVEEPPMPCRCKTDKCRGYINEYENAAHAKEKIARFHIARRGTSFS